MVTNQASLSWPLLRALSEYTTSRIRRCEHYRSLKRTQSLLVKDAVPHTFNRQTRNVQGQNTNFQLSENIPRYYHSDARTWSAISLGRPSVYPTIRHRSEEVGSVQMHRAYMGDTATLKPPARSTAKADCSVRENHLQIESTDVEIRWEPFEGDLYGCWRRLLASAFRSSSPESSSLGAPRILLFS
jgi:hypothetical protein